MSKEKQIIRLAPGVALCAIAALLDGPVARGAESSCDVVLADRHTVLEKTLSLAASEHADQVLTLPGATDELILVSEQGIDVTVSVLEGTREVDRVASPISRTGTPRLLTGPGASPATLKLETRGDSPDRRQVTVRVFDSTGLPESCIALQRELAAGDSAYARARALSEGPSNAPQGNAPREYRSAADHYLAAIHLQSPAPTATLAHSQLELATLLYDWVQDWSAARTWAQAAADTYGRIGDAYGRARADSIDAAAFMEVALSYRTSPTGGRQETASALAAARAKLTSLVAFHAGRGERFEQALAQNNIGLAYYYEGRNNQAIPAYQTALALFQPLHESRWVQITLQNIALTEWELGRISASISQYEQVLAMMGSSGDPMVRASVLNNCGQAYWVSGRFDSALKQFVEALDLERKKQDAREQARSLHGIGRVYEALGESSLALDFYRQGLALRTPESDPRGRASGLRTTANLLREQGHADEAVALDQEALTLASTATTLAQIRIQLARDLASLQRPSEALDTLEAVIREGPAIGSVTLARARVERARQLTRAGNFTAAEADLRSALLLLRGSEAPVEEFSAWSALAEVQARRQLFPAALTSLDRALRLAEEVRLQSTNPELRAALLQPLRPALDLKITVLNQLRSASGHSREPTAGRRYAELALQTSERDRDRTLEDFRRLDTRAPRLAPLLEQRRVLYQDLATHHYLLEARRASTPDGDSRAEAIRADIVSLRARIDSINTLIAANGAAEALEVSGEASARIDLRRIPADTALIEYWIGEQEAFAWVLTQSNLEMIPLGPSAPITAAALALQESLARFGSVTPAERRTRAERLSALVLQPLQSYFGGRHTLIFSPDQALHYVPFAALHTTLTGQTQFLIADHDVALAPSIRTLLESHPPPVRPRQTGRMLLVADPVYSADDERITRQNTRLDLHARTTTDPSLFRGTSADIALPRLDGSRREADLIASRLLPGQVDRLEGFNATRERFLQSPLQQYRYIHVASHAVSDAEVPGLSALILTLLDPAGHELEGRVLAADLATVRLDADLVVLSGCQTALGRNVAGEGLMGLAYIVRARGARAVVSSLWEVSDAATAQLMSGFYEAYLERQATVAGALSEVMRHALVGELADPSEWAAFSATIGEFEVRIRPQG